jgi:hypothetical protein
MDSYDLNKALDDIFLADYLSDSLKDLRSLNAVYFYYRENDAPEELDNTANELFGLLVKIQLLQKANEYPSVPTEFKCKFENSKQLPGAPTFSPIIKVPKRVMSPEFINMLNEIEQKIKKLDLARLKAYVKMKAVKAGDFTIKK